MHLLAILVEVQQKNALHKNSHSDRYPAFVKDLAAAIFLLAGRVAYRFIQQTIFEAALPMEMTTRRHIACLGLCPVTEVGIVVERLASLPKYFSMRGYTLPFYHLASDDVAVKAELNYRHTDGALFGLAEKDETLCNLVATPQTFKELQDIIAEKGLATRISAWILVPLDPRLPHAVCALFAEDKQATASDVARRRDTLVTCLQRVGIAVLSFSTDAAAPLLKAMKEIQHVCPFFFFFCVFFLYCALTFIDTTM